MTLPIEGSTVRQVYFSHSYRDRSINSYFLDRFVQADFALLADQKSPTWCVAKLERYMLESSGFVSIIPRRAATDKLGYSPYIGHQQYYLPLRVNGFRELSRQSIAATGLEVPAAAAAAGLRSYTGQLSVCYDRGASILDADIERRVPPLRHRRNRWIVRN
jgi:hypothetical protein